MGEPAQDPAVGHAHPGRSASTRAAPRLLQTSVGRDTAALDRVDLATGKTTLLGRATRPTSTRSGSTRSTAEPQAFTLNYLKPEITVLKPAMQNDVDLLKKARRRRHGHEPHAGRTLWTVVTDDALAPAIAYLYDRKAGKVTKLFEHRPALAKAPLAPMHPLEIKARDGLKLVVLPDAAAGSDTTATDARLAAWCSTCTAARGRATTGASTPEHQWLANRGYAVLSVNYPRLDRLRQEVHQRRQQRVGRQDARRPARRRATGPSTRRSPIADKVAIMGGSYGGYATLVGLTFTPETFACGVDIVGPSNLVTLLNTIPPYWAAASATCSRTASATSTPTKGRSCSAERSPLTRVDEDQAAAADRPGRQRPARQAGRGRPDRQGDEGEEDPGHLRALSRRRPRLSPAARTACRSTPSPKAFLRQRLGGRFEPIGDDFKGSTITVPAGAQHVPGLEAALK